MSYCFNPDCIKPHNADENKFCQGCGFSLRLLGRYRAISRLGKCGFGKTYLAVDEGRSPISNCVIKQLLASNLSPEALENVTRLFEEEALRRLELGTHPQIPTLLAHFAENQLFYLVEELIDGVNLRKVVEEEGTFSEAEIWQLLTDLLPILKFSHDHQVIHRDIKPENIICRTSHTLTPLSPPLSRREAQDQLLSWRGNLRGKLVLVDFGSAKLVTDIEALKRGTNSGSPEYVAPEQARGKAVFASDLYSLGVTCIYLLTGIPPFDLFDVVNNCWVWRDYLTQDVSESLAQILDKLLEYNLRTRFQSVEEVRQSIKEVRGNSHHEKPSLSTPDLGFMTKKWQYLHTFEGDSDINSVAFSPKGNILASGSNDNSICLWDLETKAELTTLTGHSNNVKSVAFNPDGTIFASGSDDCTVKLWDLNNCQEIYTFSGHSHAVKSIAFSPNGNLLASGSWDKTIKLWNVQTNLPESTLKGHLLQVSSVAFSPCGDFLASGSFDRTVRLYELSSGRFYPLSNHSWAVFAVAFSPDGKILATGSGDNTVILWDVKTRKALYTLAGHSWSVVALAFTPDGETLVSASWDKTIKLWEVSTGKEIGTLGGHFDSVCTVAISPCGKIIASGSKDKTVKLWCQVTQLSSS
ncbi:MAG: serine/threonine-protein kinase [Potamolinea sp.]